MLIGTLALTGFPFLSGFYSKDAIIEFAYFKNSNIGYYAMTVGILTAFLTAIYSWRLFFKTFHGKYNNSVLPIEETHESPIVMLVPLIFLALGALFAGYAFKELLIGHHYVDFWKKSIFFIKEIEHLHLPLWVLLSTPVLVVSAIPLSYYLYVKNTEILSGVKKLNEPLYNFLLNKWYFDELYEAIFVKPLKLAGSFLWKKGDQNTIDRYGPDGFSKIIKYFSNKAVKFQSGYIYDYAFVMLLGLSFLLTYLMIK
jgi:NADH-quinone oxidoreductase subunit L